MPLDDVVNFRFDPFTESYSPNDISNEEHTIPNNSPYYIRLKEVPKEDSPSSVTVYDVTAGSNMTEVTGNPGDNEFRVDYKYQTGYIQFNSADAGHTVRVSYKGIGSRIIAELWNDRFDLFKAHKHNGNNEDQLLAAQFIKHITGETEAGKAGSDWVDVPGASYDLYLPDNYSKMIVSLEFRSNYNGYTSYVRFRIGANYSESSQGNNTTSYQWAKLKLEAALPVSDNPNDLVTVQIQVRQDYGQTTYINGNTGELWFHVS